MAVVVDSLHLCPNPSTLAKLPRGELQEVAAVAGGLLLVRVPPGAAVDMSPGGPLYFVARGCVRLTAAASAATFSRLLNFQASLARAATHATGGRAASAAATPEAAAAASAGPEVGGLGKLGRVAVERGAVRGSLGRLRRGSGSSQVLLIERWVCMVMKSECCYCVVRMGCGELLRAHAHEQALRPG